ncbi:G-type lectin S-receptor-like serine/threonine-protein kinase RLK1 [Pyrus ussuriensis x Pyrus communis]|uniref:G-type lectin S-receptor-like serine/threonine-protein kinase RLK1 n=1 Tax=Pyrus ussuriensis x Pyrus communis TaxID=2448454 RepID=A0A5N5I9T8_9ROSA|nr:G-type lectin S-receptor-like serine/threonine-protein kinase RLK1 [Pyrus ussuriensis x Pyrus communis]
MSLLPRLPCSILVNLSSTTRIQRSFGRILCCGLQKDSEFRKWRVEDVALRSYTYCELEKATKGFRVIPSNGGRVVAIKKLEKMANQGDREFRNEMNAIGMTHHKNLVKLLGYCHEGSNMLLVYEYMTNGSLVDFFFSIR